VQPYLATDDPKEMGHLDLAIICVKSRSLEEACHSLSSNLGDRSTVLLTLNGVEVASRCRRSLSHPRVLPGCIYLSAHIESPGVVRQVGGAGPFYFGPEDQSRDGFVWIEDLLSGAGIKAELVSDIKIKVWEKYLFVGSLATITAATRLTIGQVVRDVEAKLQWISLMQEMRDLALAQGVILDQGLIERNLSLAERIPAETKTSMQMDIESGRPPELDIFIEYVLTRSTEHGLEAPAHEMFYRMIQDRMKDRG